MLNIINWFAKERRQNGNSRFSSSECINLGKRNNYRYISYFRINCPLAIKVAWLVSNEVVKRYEPSESRSPRTRKKTNEVAKEREGRTTVEGRGAEFNNEFRNSMRRLRRDRSTPVHARTNVRGRVSNNRLPLSLGMLRTATSLQIVPTLRVLLLSLPPHPLHFPAQPLSRNFPGAPPVAPTGILNGYRSDIHVFATNSASIRSRELRISRISWFARDPGPSCRLRLRTSFYLVNPVSLIIVRHSQSTLQLIRLFYVYFTFYQHLLFAYFIKIPHSRVPSL